MGNNNIMSFNDIVEKQIEAIRAIPGKNISNAAEKMSKCSGKVVTTGIGKAGLIARKVSATLSSTGTPSVFMHAADAQHGDLGILKEVDIILSFSNSGKTREVVETISSARSLYPNIFIITITSDENSILAKTSDLVIPTGNYPEFCPLGLAPTSSSLAMLSIGDILSVMVMQSKDFGIQDFHSRHHGGYLGKMLKNNFKGNKKGEKSND